MFNNDAFVGIYNSVKCKDKWEKLIGIFLYTDGRISIYCYEKIYQTS